ncbi:LON peptidase substrate-binding domain-containing protein [Roseisolibacter agri]|uniref:Peptidase n=1 Tax=Roseisolibacter agri TaxID=2014610 RepID=A0AA37VD48_9BACT|nr:LON peptidase substrate-binding domain-containing protein [Roseisolibacter agri]GLC28453.1 peptidase [Roseisolibacter agri]
MTSSARLPLFPLPLVLFPGATLPLHVFEPRYRALLADCERGDGRFGIVLSAGSEPPRAGAVGCVAELRDVVTLPDGRSNILVEGAERFAVARLVESETAYLVAEVRPWTDEPEPDAHDTLRTLDAGTREAFQRVARAARAIADDGDPIPDLPSDPAALSFAIAAAVELELGTRQRLLSSRSAVARLREVHEMLTRALPGVEMRAQVHVGARRNGHGPYAPPDAPPSA